MSTETKHININLIELNKGQIEGVPENPRYIVDEDYRNLREKIRKHPEFYELRQTIVYPLNGKFIIICGNMRFLAAKDEGFKKVPCIVLPEDTTAEKIRAYAMIDNIQNGNWNWDSLANEWNTEELKDFGLKFPDDVPNDSADASKLFGINVKCPTEDERDDLINYLESKGYKVKKTK